MENINNMVNEIFENTNKSINAAIYVDYENVLKRLKEYKIHPVNDIDMFRTIGTNLKNKNIDIVKYIAFANFDDFDFKKNDQSLIQSFGVDTRHTARDAKTSSDIDLIVEVLQDLFRKSNIDLFVIISSDRDFIPLLKAIKLENKKTLVISTKNGFNEIVKVFSSHHEYIESIFKFDENGYTINPVVNNVVNIGVNKESITLEHSEKAKEMAKILNESPLWSKYLNDNQYLVGLNGFANMIITKIRKELILKDVLYYFQVAHTLEYVCIYENEADKNLYFKEIENKNVLKDVE